MSGIFSVFGFNVVSSLELYIASKAERDNPNNNKKTINAVKTLIDEINKRQGKLPPPTMLELIYFNIFKAISELNINEGPADYEFYRDKTDYFYNTKINPFKQMMAKQIAGKEIAKMVKDR